MWRQRCHLELAIHPMGPAPSTADPLMGLARPDEAKAQRGAAERGHAPDEALGLKMLKDVPIFINVRFAGDADCSVDQRKGPYPLRRRLGRSRAFVRRQLVRGLPGWPAAFVFPAVHGAGHGAPGPRGRPASSSEAAARQVAGRQARQSGEAQKGLGG